jgi:uncharacterized protein YkwD
MTRVSTTMLIILGAVAGALALTLALMAGSGPPPATAAGGCPHANSEPDQGSNGDFRQALICLINNRRTSRDKAALDTNGKLRDVAGAHTDVMLQQDCFEHRCNGEPSLTRRLKNAGYLRGSNWAYVENIGYAGTPKQMINRWMDRRSARRNILHSAWVDLGVGVGHGTPDPDKPDNAFVTYTTIFGDGG